MVLRDVSLYAGHGETHLPAIHSVPRTRQGRGGKSVSFVWIVYRDYLEEWTEVQHSLERLYLCLINVVVHGEVERNSICFIQNFSGKDRAEWNSSVADEQNVRVGVHFEDIALESAADGDQNQSRESSGGPFCP